MKAAKERKERPSSYNERRVEAEREYQKIYSRFRTHNFLDWHTHDGTHKSFMRAVPPYSDRFDEFLGFWLTGAALVEVPGTLERHFPKPDQMDLDYLEDVLTELDKISEWKNEPYRTYKGSKIDIGPFLNRDYSANIARARKWVDSMRSKLQKAESLLVREDTVVLSNRLDSTSESKTLSLRQIALLAIYRGEIIRNDNRADDLARKYGHQSGEALYKHYIKWVSDRDRRQVSGRQVKPLVKDIEAILPYLNSVQRKSAEHEIIMIYG